MSIKKTMAVVGCCVFFFVCVMEMFQEDPQTAIVLSYLAGLIVALFGLKGYFGIQTKKLENGNG